MTQQQLMGKFLKGEKEGVSGGSGNLKIEGDKLIHYNTIIAERFNDKIILNTTRYSLVTGRIQKMLKESIDENKLVIVRRVSEGCRDTLTKFLVQ